MGTRTVSAMGRPVPSKKTNSGVVDVVLVVLEIERVTAVLQVRVEPVVELLVARGACCRAVCVCVRGCDGRDCGTRGA